MKSPCFSWTDANGMLFCKTVQQHPSVSSKSRCSILIPFWLGRPSAYSLTIAPDLGLQLGNEKYKDTSGTSNTLGLFLGQDSDGDTYWVLVRALTLDVKTIVLKNVEVVACPDIEPILLRIRTPTSMSLVVVHVRTTRSNPLTNQVESVQQPNSEMAQVIFRAPIGADQATVWYHDLNMVTLRRFIPFTARTTSHPCWTL